MLRELVSLACVKSHRRDTGLEEGRMLVWNGNLHRAWLQLTVGKASSLPFLCLFFKILPFKSFLRWQMALGIFSKKNYYLCDILAINTWIFIPSSKCAQEKDYFASNLYFIIVAKTNLKQIPEYLLFQYVQ